MKMKYMVRLGKLRLFTIALLLVLACVQAPVMAQSAARDFSKERARDVPAWVRDGVIYEIFPRTFSAAGNLNGVTARLDDLKRLGVTILWLMPIHPVGQEKKKGTFGSPYAVRDYYAVNPDYGTKEDLRRLVSEAHKRGMKVIIDIVANHTAWDSVMMKTPSFYTHDASGRIVPPVADWADVADLDYNNPQLRKYIVDMLKYWIREADLDGFRCDVAMMIPTDFWESARTELESIKPGLFMLAEAHEPDLMVRAFDLDYAWPLHATLTNVIMGNTPATAIEQVWREERAQFPVGAQHMRFSDNHDERRAIARFGERAALAASALVFTLDGVPMLYNGMEVGDTTESGAPALFEKLPILWSISERRPEFPRFYSQIIELRRSSDALRHGDLNWLNNSEPARVVSFMRRAPREEMVVLVNLSNRPAVATVEVANDGSFQDVSPDVAPPLPPDAPAPERATGRRPVGLPAVHLDAWGYRIFRRPIH